MPVRVRTAALDIEGYTVSGSLMAGVPVNFAPLAGRFVAFAFGLTA